MKIKYDILEKTITLLSVIIILFVILFVPLYGLV